jgi:hypothetical protein
MLCPTDVGVPLLKDSRSSTGLRSAILCIVLAGGLDLALRPPRAAHVIGQPRQADGSGPWPRCNVLPARTLRD